MPRFDSTRFFTLFLLGGLCAATLAAAELTEAEKNGRRIYRDGLSSRQSEIIAVMGEGGIEVPGSALPCASCHGRDGRGRSEGGINPSDLTWPVLSKPYGTTTPTGRKIAPYDDSTLRRAIGLGIDSSGNALNAAMPRYRLSMEDAADLIAYLKRLGTEPEPGVTDDVLRVGLLRPPSVSASVGSAQEAALKAYFSEVNKTGVYGRRLELVTMESRERPDLTKAALEDFLDREKPFVMVSPFLAGADAELSAVAEAKEVPFLGPSTLRPKDSFPINRYVFFLLPGEAEQARALVQHAADTRGGDPQAAPRSALLVAEGAPDETLLGEAVRQQADRLRLPAPERVVLGGGGYDANAVVAKLAAAKYDAVFFIGRGVEAIQVLSAMAEAELTPKIYLLSLDAARTLGGGGKVSFAGPAFMAFPLLPGGAPGEDLTEFRRLAQAHQLPRQHEAAQRLALGSAKLLADTLLKLGRTITRESLIEALEQHYRYYGGYVPPLTFGPNRRIGPQGAYVLKVNLSTGETVPVTGFLPVD
jgi:ABC-type branched-subunit amino acid transport system substrate-binding protein